MEQTVRGGGSMETASRLSGKPEIAAPTRAGQLSTRVQHEAATTAGRLTRNHGEIIVPS